MALKLVGAKILKWHDCGLTGGREAMNDLGHPNGEWWVHPIPGLDWPISRLPGAKLPISSEVSSPGLRRQLFLLLTKRVALSTTTASLHLSHRPTAWELKASLFTTCITCLSRLRQPRRSLPNPHSDANRPRAGRDEILRAPVVLWGQDPPACRYAGRRKGSAPRRKFIDCPNYSLV